jgi:hypothetical protein
MTSTGQHRATGYAPANGVDVYWESQGSGGTPDTAWRACSTG